MTARLVVVAATAILPAPLHVPGDNGRTLCGRIIGDDWRHDTAPRGDRRTCRACTRQETT